MAANTSGESTPATFAKFYKALMERVVRSGLPDEAMNVLHAALQLTSGSQIPADAYESAGALAEAAKEAVRANIEAAIASEHALVKRASDDDRKTAHDEALKLVQAAVDVVFPPPQVKPEFKGVIYPLRAIPETVAEFAAWQYANVQEGRNAGVYPGDRRRPYGTLVLGPSGSGKSAFLHHELRRQLQQAAKRAPLAVVVANLYDVLRLPDDWYSQGTALERAEKARKVLGERVRDLVLKALDDHTLTAPTTYVAVCLDEIGVLPGVLSDKAAWDSVVKKVHSITEMPEYKGKICGVHVAAAGTAAESGVQQRLASNLEEITKLRLAQWTPATVLRTICSKHPDSAALTAIVEVLCGEPHGIVSAMSNARMAVATLCDVLNPTFMSLAWDGSKVNTTFVRNQRSYLLRHVVETYCSQNGLSQLLRAVGGLPANDKQRGIVSGVGLGALWVSLRQRTASAQTSAGARDDGNGENTKEEQELEDVCAHAAEHFGLVASNAGKHVGDGELPYQMHAGTVLVALHLMGLDVTEMPANWRALEELVALHESVTAAGEFLLGKTGVGAKLNGIALPTALQGTELPLTTKPIYPPLVWDRRTAPTLVDSTVRVILPLDVPCNVMAQDKGPFADVMGHHRISQAKDKLATTEVVRAADIPAEMAKAGLLQLTGADNAANKAANKAAATAATGAGKGSPPAAKDAAKAAAAAGATPAIKAASKAGKAASKAAPRAPATPAIKAAATAATEASAAAPTSAPDDAAGDAAAAEANTQAASTKAKNKELQQRVLDALLRQWKRYETICKKELKRTAASFAPGTSRLGDRHLYPLSLLLPIDSLTPAPFPVYADEGPNPAFEPWRVANTAFPPSKPRKTPDSQPPQAAGADAPLLPHCDWCEFRMVVTDLGKVRFGGGDDGERVSRTLAVFERESTTMPWTIVQGTNEMETGVLPRLREDMALTLLAVTVTHVCDAAGLSETPPLQQPSRPQPLSPEKK